MRRRILNFLTLICLLALLFAACGPRAEADPAAHVISHRGVPGEAPEHSFASYDLAVAYGSRYIEQDLVLSADGTLYVSHDDTPERLAGEARPFVELTDAEIDALRTAEGQPFLRLREVFARYPAPVRFVVEVRYEVQLEPLFALIEEFGLQDRLIVEVWNAPKLEMVRDRFPSVRRMLLVKTQSALEAACREPAAQIVAMEVSLLTEANCALIRGSGKEVCVWTLKEPEEIRRAIDLGVDLYFTDDTAGALALEAECRTPAKGG